MKRRILLFCGILASVLYIVATMLAANQWASYDSISMSVSELSAIDAPSRPLMILLLTPYSLLTIAFGLGVRQSARGRRPLRVVGGLLVAYGAFCLTAAFTPMHQRGTQTSLTDTLHIAGTIVDVIFILLIMGFGATAFGRNFRRYTIATILVLLFAGVITGMDGPRIATNLPTPMVGFWERVNIFSFMLWAGVLAVRVIQI
jgi:hypothetical protein